MLKSLKLFATAVILAAALATTSTAHADNRVSHPTQADSILVFSNYKYFKETGEFALCDDGRDMSDCASQKRLTPAQLVAKLHPRMMYVGFRLEQHIHEAGMVLYVYIRRKP